MAGPKKPATQRGMIEQMWWVIFGSNGGSLISRVDAINQRLDLYMENRAATCPMNRYGQEEERRKALERDRQRTRVQKIQAAIAAGALILALTMAIIAIAKP